MTLVALAAAAQASAQPLINPARQLKSTPTAVKTTESVRFIKGDFLHGTLIGFNKKDGFLWRHEGIRSEIHIDPAKISRITLQPRDSSKAKSHRARVQLLSGDELPGEILEMDAEHLKLETWYAGPLSIRRNAVSVILPGEAGGKLVYTGPDSPKGWVNNSNIAIPTRENAPTTGYLWSYHQGGFDSRGSSAVIGRSFKDMPDRVNLEFDINWTNTLSLYVNLHTDNLSSYSSGNSYCVRLTQTSAILYKYEATPNRRSSSRVGNSVSYRIPAGIKSAHISMRVDKTRQTIALIVNGRLIKQWTDNGIFAGLGKGIMFTSRTSSPMRLTTIRLSHWDGGLPASVTATAPATSDLLRMVNNDTFSGDLHHIRDGKVNFSTAFSKNLPIPLTRISTITLSGKAIPLKPHTNTVRLTLPGRARLTAELLEWKDKQAKLHHPSFGNITLDTTAIHSIDFINTQTSKTRSQPASRATGSPYNIPP